MEPENNALLVREAFEKVDTPMKLALIGDAPYAADYIRRVRDTADPRVVIPGAIYGEGYRELGSHCFAYIHATEVGGTHPALIEAMGRGALTLYPGHPRECRGRRRRRAGLHARESGRRDAAGSGDARSRARDLARAGHGAGADRATVGTR